MARPVTDGKIVSLEAKNIWFGWISSADYREILKKYLIKNGILKYISRGQSPIKQHGRFTAYKVDRKPANAPHWKKYYPEFMTRYYPSKRKRPVNLKLSGDYLNKIDIGYQRGPRTEIGLIHPTKKQRLMFESHNLGLHKFVPMRKHLPTRKGESFQEGIMVELRRGILAELRSKKFFK